MRRPLLLLLALFAVAALVYQTSQTTVESCCGSASGDELAWLRDEFQLNETNLAKVREVHNGYRMQCSTLQLEVAARRTKVRELAAGSTNVSPELAQELAAVAALRLEAQKQMLNHFYAVSRALPPEQRSRYLSNMCQMTLSEPPTESGGRSLIDRLRGAPNHVSP